MTLADPNQAIQRGIEVSTELIDSTGLVQIVLIGVGVTGPA
jgi:hypothetical protein